MRPGFEIVLEHGRAEIDLFQCEHSSQPLVSIARNPSTGIASVLIGAVLRTELNNWLPDGFALHERSDAEIALAVFEGHGSTGAFRRLMKSPCTLVIADVRQRTIYAMRDAIGYWPLYWDIEPDGTIRVGTRLVSFTRRAHVSLDVDFLALFQMTPLITSELGMTDRTAFKPVRRVRPGEAIEFQEARKPRSWFWNWPFPDGEPHSIPPDEAAERFREYLKRACASRIEGARHIAIEVSGGLDSSSVACLARRLAPSKRLTTISVVYETTQSASEREYINEVILQMQGGASIESKYLAGSSATSYQWFTQDSVPEHDEPCLELYSVGTSRLRVANARNASVLLTGIGAETTLTFPPLHLADLIRRLRWKKALAEAHRWAYGKCTPFLSVLWEYGLRPCCPSWLRGGIGPLARGGYGARPPNVGLFTVPPWICRSFAKRTRMWQVGREFAHSIYRYPAERSFLEFILRTMGGSWAAVNLAAPLGIRVLHPFLDVDLLSYCLQLPRDVRQLPESENKSLLRAAMRGILPEKVRTRRTQAAGDLQHLLGLNQNRQHLQAMIKRSKAVDDLELFDKGTLLEALRVYSSGLGDAMEEGRMGSALALIVWLDNWSAWGQIPQIPTASYQFTGEEGRLMTVTRAMAIGRTSRAGVAERV
jgi:asparagine synthase (glutamine-hydrolysing)